MIYWNYSKPKELNLSYIFNFDVLEYYKMGNGYTDFYIEKFIKEKIESLESNDDKSIYYRII